MRSTRLRQILALSAMVALVGCSTGGTGGTDDSTDSVQRSSRILKKKKPTVDANASSSARKTTDDATTN